MPKKVKFNAAKLSFSKVRKLYKIEKFSSLIFQHEILDADKNNEEYVLIAYPVDDNGKILDDEEKIVLEPDNGVDIEKKKKVILANLPYSRAEIKKFIDSDPREVHIDHLYFTPKSYPDANKPNDPYVAYSVESRGKNKAIIFDGPLGNDLKPSPPAPPEGN